MDGVDLYAYVAVFYLLSYGKREVYRYYTRVS